MPVSDTAQIHPTAQVSSGAQLGRAVTVGPFAVIGDGVVIGEETSVGPHTVLEGPTYLGKRNRIVGQSAIGTDPQDLKYQGEETSLHIGDENIIREFVTINRGTAQGGGKTTIGSRNLFMTGVHVAHDCHLGNDGILANAATLAGHVEIANGATVGAFTGVHQFCRVGRHAFIGGYSVITRDAPPFIKTVGHRNQARTYGINGIGLSRKGFSEERILALRKAYRWIFRKDLTVPQARDRIVREELQTPDVESLLQFLGTSSRGFIR